MDYVFEQQGRRPIVFVAALIGLGMAGIGIHNGAPWPFTAIALVSCAMTTAVLLKNSRSGMRLEGNRLMLFKDQWHHELAADTIQRVRVTHWTDGQPSIWIECAGAPPYRLPGTCFGSATQLTAAFRARGIPVD